MSTTAHYHPRGIDIDLGGENPLPRELYLEIVSWRGHIDRSSPPVLTCLGNHTPMYVYRHPHGRYYARHFPGDNPDGHSHVIATMSDEHRRQAEYGQRAAVDHGLDAMLERSTGNKTRLDLAVVGADSVGFEIQRSQLSRAKAKSRAKLSFDAGWPTAWITDRENDPDWVEQVPTARLTLRGGWDEAMPPRNTANMIVSDFTRTRDRSTRSGWWYHRTPRVVLYDELVYLMAAGDIVPVTMGRDRQHVVLARKEARDLIDSCTYPGASLWLPTTATPQRNDAPQHFTRHCAHEDGADSGVGTVVDLSPTVILSASLPVTTRLVTLPGHGVLSATADAIMFALPGAGTLVATAYATKFTLPGDLYGHGALSATARISMGITCRGCGKDACHPDSVALGLCRRCDLKQQAKARRIGLAQLSPNNQCPGCVVMHAIHP
jgi:hypothetical protein